MFLCICKSFPGLPPLRLQPRELRPPDEGGRRREIYPRRLEPGAQPGGLHRLLHLPPDARGARGRLGRGRVRGRRQEVVLQGALRPGPDGSCRRRKRMGRSRSEGGGEAGQNLY